MNLQFCYNCVFQDKIVTFCAVQITIVHRRVAMLLYINGAFSQLHMNNYATGQ